MSWSGAGVVAGSLAGAFLAHALVRRAETRGRRRVAGLFRFTRNVFFPTLGLWGLLLLVRLEPAKGFAGLAYQVLATLLWIEAAYLVLSFLSVALFTDEAGRRGKIRVPSLFRDLVRAAILSVVFFLILGEVWSVDTSHWTWLGAAASFVLGFAAQDTLGSLFSGIALLFEQSFQEGDWVSVQGQVAQVERMTWRAVRIRTFDNDYIVVPNSAIAKDVILNYSRPTPRHARRVKIGLS